MKEAARDNRLRHTSTGFPEYKRYLDEMPGVPIGDDWDDIRPLNSQAQERLGYPTQKPRALLERIIAASSNEGDVVLDPFCGCGTAVDAAQKLGRRWIGIDVTHIAIGMIENRMREGYPGIEFETIEALEDEGVAALKEELALLKRKIDKGVIAQARPALDGVKSAAVSSFVEGYLRKGAESGLELKAIGSSSDAIGGYAVPREIDEVIDRTLTAISPIRQIANVVKVGSAGYRKLVSSGGTPSGWVGFEAARPETGTGTFSEIIPASGDLYANPAASQQMLDDAMFDVEAWLASEIATEFARAEGMAFVKGTGVSQPLGFLASPNAATADGVRAMGALQFIGTGTAGAFPATNPADKLLDLIQTLRQPYRQGAVFVMNSATATAIRKFKTPDGAYIWQPGLSAGQASTLLGYPVVEAEDMPDVAANSLGIAFGNFKAGYTVAERNATTILRDPYTHKPYVHFYATKRVGGQVTNSEAIKLLKFA